MNTLFYGGRNAGVIALLTLLAKKYNVIKVMAVDEPVKMLAQALNIDIVSEITPELIKENNIKLFICCHGRKIIKKEILDLVLAINIHPCLSMYPGADPIQRFLQDNAKNASVGAHWMTEDVDRGKIICENFIETKGKTVIEIYNEIYPLYSKTLIDVLNFLKKL